MKHPFLHHHKKRLAALLLCSTVTCVQAQAAQEHLELPGQALAEALQQVGSTLGVAVAFDPEVVKGHTAPPLQGEYAPEEALEILLEGSGLEVRKQSNGAYVVSEARQSAPPPSSEAHEPEPSRSQVSSSRRATTGAMVEEVIVTAQKREESLQDTPISIAVMSSSELDKQGISSLDDFSAGMIPALRVAPTSGRTSSMMVVMRGIGSGDPMEIARDAAVGVYLDGVYLGRVQGLSTSLIDLERVEVLRGPQGTLFGRNTIAGAISMVSRKPAGELDAEITAGIERFRGKSTRVNLDLPEFGGLKIKGSGVWNQRDGWVRNSMPGEEDWYAREQHGGRISALWDPVDNVSLLYSYDKSRDESAIGYSQIDGLYGGAPPLPELMSVQDSRVRRGQVGVPLEPSIGKVSGHSLQVDWQVNDHITVRPIVSYRKMSQTQYDNSGMLLIPYMPHGVFGRVSYAETEQDQRSEEVQVLGDFDRLHFIVGGFHFKENTDNLAHSAFSALFNADGSGYSTLPVVLGGPDYPDRSSYVRNRSTAVFTQATFTPDLLDDRLHLTAGARWTRDRKYGALDRRGGGPVHIPFRFSSSRVDPAATVAFDWNADASSYLRWSRAYRAGGANSRSDTFGTFDEEGVSTWEIGSKHNLLDNRLQLNLAAYRTRYSDRQVDFPNPTNPSNYETINAPGSSTIKGAELDVRMAVSHRLTLGGSYNYTSWKALRDVNPFTGQLQRGVVNFSPRHSASATIDYDLYSRGDLVLTSHLGAIYSGDFYTSGVSAPQSKSYRLLNGRLTLEGLSLGGVDLSLSLWGKNLTNEKYKMFRISYDGPGLSGVSGAVFNEPRTYGLEATVRFQ